MELLRGFLFLKLLFNHYEKDYIYIIQQFDAFLQILSIVKTKFGKILLMQDKGRLPFQI